MTALIAFVRELARLLDAAAAQWKALENKATGESEQQFAHGMSVILREIANAVKSAMATTLFT